MGKFWLGFIVGIVVLFVAALCYVRFGFIDPRADRPVGSLESKLAMPALDASVDRRAPQATNPVAPTDANLVAGMQIYQLNCASCHGDIYHREGMFAEALYPRAPQFLEDAPDMPEYQNFYIIQHGVRLSGMPAWRSSLSDQQIWQVTTFLSHMDKLSTQVSQQWKAAAAAADVNSPTPPKAQETMPMK